MNNFQKLIENIDNLEIDASLSDEELILLFVEQVRKLADLPDPYKAALVALLINRIRLVSPELGDKLWEATAVLSSSFMFKLETHNPPSQAGDSGIHLQLGGKEEFFHTPLEEVLRRLTMTPISGLGGIIRDISGPIDYGNEMHEGPQTPVVQIGGKTGKEGFGGSGRKDK